MNDSTRTYNTNLILKTGIKQKIIINNKNKETPKRNEWERKITKRCDIGA